MIDWNLFFCEAMAMTMVAVVIFCTGIILAVISEWIEEWGDTRRPPGQNEES